MATTALPSAGRSSTNMGSYDAGRYSTTTTSTAELNSSRKKRLRLVTSSSSSNKSSGAFGNAAYSAGASPSISSSFIPPPRRDSKAAGSAMKIASTGRTNSIPVNEPRHAKLHKRGNSGSSINGIPARRPPPLQDEAYSPSATSASTPTESIKIRPYIRKLSTKDSSDQGRLDLSKSLADNHPSLSGLGINAADSPNRSATDVTFAHTHRHGSNTHARTTSGESVLSTASGQRSAKGTFVHPMRQIPRQPSATPPQRRDRSFDGDDRGSDDGEADDVLTADDFRLGHGAQRSRRSTSISSTPIIAPTPLSQSYTANDWNIPKAQYSVASQSNLSLHSTRTSSSSKIPQVRSHRSNTDRSFPSTVPTSFDNTASSSTRTSFDRAFSFASGGKKTSGETESSAIREQRILAARRKFEEKEMEKDRKAEAKVLRRRATEESSIAGRKSFSSLRPSGRRKVMEERTAPVIEDEKLQGRGRERERPRGEDGKHSGGAKFSAWFKTRMLSCGGKN